MEAIAGQDLHAQDIAEQKALVADLKAKRDAKKRAELKAAQEVEEDDEMDGGDAPATPISPTKSKSKRVREDEEEQLKFQFKEPEVEERAVVTNRKVTRSFSALEPRTKSVAWGVAAFAFGLGAVSFLPNFF